MDLQQIGLRHPVADLVRDIQANRTGIPRRTFVAEGLYEINMVLATGPPTMGRRQEWFRWHIKILPRITGRGGLELGTGLDVTTRLPEDCAALLRAALPT